MQRSMGLHSLRQHRLKSLTIASVGEAGLQWTRAFFSLGGHSWALFSEAEAEYIPRASSSFPVRIHTGEMRACKPALGDIRKVQQCSEQCPSS